MRLRERYHHRGPDEFGDTELLALVLGTGAGGRGTLAMAAELLEQFGDLDGIASAQTAELCAVRGVGRARAARVHAALQVGRRSLRRPLEAPSPVTSPEQAAAVLTPALRALVHEELHALYLDRRRRSVAHRRLTRGSDAFTVVDPRQVLRPAVALGASGVILAHNHPSGDPTPSPQDREVTRRVASAGRVVGVQLLDHIVVGDRDWVSLAQFGLCG